MDADSFAIVYNRRFRRQERVTVVGTKQSDCFQKCRPRIDQFVSRVPKKYPEQYIRDMIAYTGVTPIEVNKLSHDNAMMTSYKVIAWRDEEERLMESDAWPRLISCRRYIRPRFRRQKHHKWDNWHRDGAESVFGGIHYHQLTHGHHLII